MSASRSQSQRSAASKKAVSSENCYEFQACSFRNIHFNIPERAPRVRTRGPAPAFVLRFLLRKAGFRAKMQPETIGRMMDEFESPAWKTAKTYADAPHE